VLRETHCSGYSESVVQTEHSIAESRVGSQAGRQNGEEDEHEGDANYGEG